MIGVILSGALGDGTLGLLAVKRAGGVAIVQNPEDAAFPSMPLTALKSVEADFVLPAAAIGRQLVELARRPRLDRTARGAPADQSLPEAAPSERPGSGKLPAGELTALICPSCGGALWEDTGRGVGEFFCHVGHRFSAEALQVLQADQLDRVLWTAVRALQDDAMLRQRMAAHAEERGMRALAVAWHARAETAQANADALRTVVEGIGTDGSAPEGATVARDERRTATDGSRRRKTPSAGRSKQGARRKRPDTGTLRRRATDR